MRVVASRHVGQEVLCEWQDCAATGLWAGYWTLPWATSKIATVWHVLLLTLTHREPLSDPAVSSVWFMPVLVPYKMAVSMWKLYT